MSQLAARNALARHSANILNMLVDKRQLNRVRSSTAGPSGESITRATGLIGTDAGRLPGARLRPTAVRWTKMPEIFAFDGVVGHKAT